MDYLDSNGLSYYDRKIKGHIDSVIENSVLPMIPKKGVVALGNNGYVTGGQVYNAIGSGGGGGTVTAEYPFPYVKVKKCKKFVAYSESKSNTDVIVYDLHTSDSSYEEQYIDSKTLNGYIAFAQSLSSGSEFSDKYAFDASFYYPNIYNLKTSSQYQIGSSYTSEGEMEIHNYNRIYNNWMTYYYKEEGYVNPKYVYTLVPPVLKIDDKIKYIGAKAFYAYNKKSQNDAGIDIPLTLYISAIEPPIIQTDSFKTFNAIHVPSGSLDLYKSANNWSAYGDFMIGDL